MKIKSITINKFRSINTPQIIQAGGRGLITLIGKNGSGKTNLLEAVKAVFDANSERYYYGARDLKYTVALELDDSEMKELGNDGDGKASRRFIQVYNNGLGNDSHDLRVNVFKSETYADALKEAGEAVKKCAAELSPLLEALIKTLNETVVDGVYNECPYSYKFEDIENSGFCSSRGSMYVGELKSLSKEVDKIINSICNSEDEISLNGYDGYRYEHHYALKFDEPNFRLVYSEPYMTDFDKRFVVTIDRDEIKRQIDKVNGLIAEQSASVKEAVKRLNRKIGKLNSLVKRAREEDDDNYERNEKEEEKKATFLQRITNAIARNYYYIPAAEEAFGKRHDYYDGYSGFRNLNRQLIETYIKLKYDGKERNKLLSEYAKGDFEKILASMGIDKEQFAADFESELNKDLPEFDREMINKITVKYKDGLNLFVVEKNGAEIPFEYTSLGRRWYFTYYFMKSCLKAGDVLILDEPGAFLHPEAQIELLRDLENVAKSNTVIMCTHSPYLISDEHNDIHVVQMSSNGTCVKHIKPESLERLKTEAGLADFNSIVLKSIIINSPGEPILCEGVRDIACIEAFMDHFGINKKNYSIMQIMGFPHIKPVIEFYINNNRYVRVLLDNDSKESILAKKIKVPKSLNEHETLKIGEIPPRNMALVFAGDDSGRQDIEGLFSQADQKIFLEKVAGKRAKKVRQNIGELLAEHGCDEETEHNMRELFKKLNLPVE